MRYLPSRPKLRSLLRPKSPSSRPEPRALATRSGETPAFSLWRHKLLAAAAILFAVSTTTALAQSPLPKNYKTIFQNKDLLVMRVHYGPHEVVPMHDHSAYPTLYIYLNNSGPVRIDHEPPVSFSVTRPPTHIGAFRLAPGMKERHSITNLGDEPSDFLRVEFKTLPPDDLKEVIRGDVPSPLLPGDHNEFEDPAIRIDRLVCPPTVSCQAAPLAARSLLVPLTDLKLDPPAAGKHSFDLGEVAWISPNSKKPLQLSPGAQALRITLLYPE